MAEVNGKYIDKVCVYYEDYRGFLATTNDNEIWLQAMRDGAIWTITSDGQ